MKSHHYSQHAAALRTELGHTLTREQMVAFHAKDAARHLAAVTRIGALPFVLVCNPLFAATSIKELVALAKAGPGKLSNGATVSGQLMVEMFKSAGIKGEQQ